MRRLKVLFLTILVLALALASCEREHVNAYGIDEDEENPTEETTPEEPEDPYTDPHEADDGGTQGQAALMVAAQLTGSWRGTIEVEFFDDEMRKHTGTYTGQFNFEQYRRSTLNGTGMEMAYDENGKMLLKEPFTWYVDISEGFPVCLKFEYREMVVKPYELDNNHFAGTMKNVDGLETDHFTYYRITQEQHAPSGNP